MLPIVVFVSAERLIMLWHPLKPRLHSIYDRDFWRHEQADEAASRRPRRLGALALA